MGNILAFDYGEHSVGVAVGNTLTRAARPLKALKAQGGKVEPAALQQLIEEWQPQLLVVGLPLNMDGTEQLLTKRARKFGNRLRNDLRLEVQFADERLTTKEAKALIFEQGGFRALAKDKGAIDAAAAAFILQDFLDSMPSA